MTRTLASRCYKVGPFAWLWGGIYRGLQIGRLWIGWTHPEWKARGW